MGKRALPFLATGIFLLTVAARLPANDDLDNYKWRIQANWWFSHPYGYFGAQNSKNEPIRAPSETLLEFTLGQAATLPGSK